jgi:hypothetical protein
MQRGRCWSDTDQRKLLLVRAVADPRGSIAPHHEVLEKLRTQRAAVSLRYFTWEPPGCHSYGAADARTRG